MDEDFIRAAKSGEIKKIKECLAAGVNVNITNPGGLNALHLASRENHPDIVTLLLIHGIDAKAITKRLNTALHIASLGGNTSVVQILLNHGANVNVQAQDDITPLYMAAQENHADIVKMLLKKKADPHIAAKGGFESVDIAVLQGHSAVAAMLLEHNAKQGLRALHVAAKKDDVDALELLVKDKRSVNDPAPNGYTPLHIAAKHDSIKAAKFLVDHGADLNAAAKHNVVPLHVASRHGQTRVLTILIEGGANLGSPTKDGLTPLHCAARDGHNLCVEVLLVHGAPVTAKTRHGLTALHMAAQGNHTASANHLLSHGAHIDDVTLDGVTPLHITAHYGHVETAQLLIEKGTDIDKRARNGYTALHIASKKNREAVVQLLLKYQASVHVKNNNGQIALHVAAFFGHVNIVLLLLQAGASLEATTIREETVLHIACRTVQIQIVRLLLRNGAKVNPKAKDGDTPLHNACRQGSASLVSLLLDNDADPDATNKEGCTASHLAARDGHEKVLESLLDHKAGVNIISKRGFTPLHEASKKGYVVIIEMLLEKKAEVNTKGKNNLTPLHVACHYDQPDVAIKLLNNGADPHATAKNGFTPLHIAAKKNQVNIVSLLLDRGVEADLITKHGVSPLHLAAQEGNVEIVDMLLEHGTSPAVQTSNGLTPLHVAVQYNQIDVVKRLLKYGAAINSTTQSGFTPLHLAAMCGHTEMAQLLLEECAEVEAKTKNGNTPLHIAAYKGHNDIVELLLKYNAPPNALNKDGYSALHIAEVTQQKWVITTLVKVTKITVKPKDKGEKSLERLHQTFLPPEDLEETLLIDANDEAEDEAHIQKKVIQEDFEETFAGLDETHSENNTTFVTESEIEVTQEEQVETMAHDNFDDFFNKLDEKNDLPNGHRPEPHVDHSYKTKHHTQGNVDAVGFEGPVGSSSPRESDVYNKNYPDNVYITGPPRTGKFLISFYVDARGAVMESKQSGIKITIPRGACTMPTRITIRLRKPKDVRTLPHLHVNESLASSIIQMSSEGMQFLKPVVMEIPHFAALRGNERELIVLRCNSGHAHWREHPATIMDDQPGCSDDMTMKVIIQEIPDKLVIVSRPLKERFVMLPEGGKIESTVVPKVHILFPSDTLNTSTKVVLQVQQCDDSLLQPNDQTYTSPIVSLDPPTILSKPITINIPCPWLAYEERNGKRNLRLLARLPRTPRKSTGDRTDYEWQDVTSKTALSIIGDNASFTTTEFTRYWIVQTNSIETLPKRINQLEQTLSVSPYSARFFVHGRLDTLQNGQLRVFLVTDEHALHEVLSHYTSVKELPHSNTCHVYDGQTIHVNLSGNLNAVDTQNLKMTFDPFTINQLNINTEVVSVDAVQSCRLTFMGSLRRDLTNNISPICSLDVHLSKDMLDQSRKSYHIDTVNDETIRKVGSDIQESWMPVATELNLSNRDKQAVFDVSCGKYDIPGVCMLEYWRSKHPSNATYKALYDALKYANYEDTAEKVYEVSPNKFSKELLPRSVTERSQTTTPTNFVNGTLESGYISDTSKDSQRDCPMETLSKPDDDSPVKVQVTEPDEPFVDYFDPNTITDDDIMANNIDSIAGNNCIDHNNGSIAGSSDLAIGNIDHTAEKDIAGNIESDIGVMSSNDKVIQTDNQSVVEAVPFSADDVAHEEPTEGAKDELVYHKDPVIDFSLLEQLTNEISQYEPIESTHGPSAYELSLIQNEESEIAVSAETVSRPPKDLVTEDDVIATALENVHAEVDMSFLDACDDEQLQDYNSTSYDEDFTKNAEIFYPLVTNDQYSSHENSFGLSGNELSGAGLSGQEVKDGDSTNLEDECSLDLALQEDVNDNDPESDSRSPCFDSVSPMESITSPDLNTSPEIIESPRSLTPFSYDGCDELFEARNVVNQIETSTASVIGEHDEGTTVVVERQTSHSVKVVTPPVDEASDGITTGVISTKSTTVTKTSDVVTTETIVVTSDEVNGGDLIKRMFGNQSSVMEFFENGEEKEEDYSSYGTQV